MGHQWEERSNRSLWKGLAAGLIGGLVASWTMNEYQKGWSAASRKLASRNGHRKQQSSAAENPTARTAHAISKKLLGKPLTPEQREKAGPIVHYAFGTLMGGLYGATSEFSSKIRMAGGVPYGAAVFLSADELALPALKLAKGATEYPISTHLYGLTSHIVWATTTDAVRRLVRKIL